MSDRVIYKNGEFLPESEAKVSIYDAGVNFGAFIFEMTRSFNGKTFKLREHIERLFNSSKYTNINIPLSHNELVLVCEEVIKRNKFNDDDEHRLLILCSPGVLSIYKSTCSEQGSNLIVTDFPLRWTVGGFSNYFKNGISAVITRQQSIPSYMLESRVKHRSRLNLWMANIEASNYKGNNNWALLTDSCGHITEGTGANFFIVKNGKLYTPPAKNILRGISRDYVLELCQELDIEYFEKDIELYDVITADEAFFTGTPFCMLPVSSINGKKIGNYQGFGCTSMVLMEKWSENVGVGIIQQIAKWDQQSVDTSGVSPYVFTNQK